MTSKEKKNVLKSFSEIEGRVKELESELEMLWSRTTSTTHSFSIVPSGGDGVNKIENAIEKMEKIVNLIDEERDNLVAVQQRIMSAIRKLPDITERRIIHLKYIGKPQGLYHRTLPLWKIANELGYSTDRINHLHGDALRNLEI